jgi:hypothetical protein
VNPAHPHIASRIQTRYIVELRLQLVCGAEKILLAPDNKDTNRQNCQRRHNKSS